MSMPFIELLIATVFPNTNIGCNCFLHFSIFSSSGFINGASVFKDGGGGKKVVAFMMFACGGLFVVNGILEIILLRKVCV